MASSQHLLRDTLPPNPWNMTIVNSTYCPVPPADEWFNAIPDIWSHRLPLMMTNNYVTIYNFHFCSFGGTFIAVAVTGYVLALVSLVCLLLLFYRSRHSPSLHLQRKLLFLLLIAIGFARAIPSHIGANKLAPVKMFWDLLGVMPWFVDNIVPLSALGDLLTGYMDLLLTFFWLALVAPRFSASWQGRALPWVLVLLTFAAGLGTFLVDHQEIASNNYNNGNVYYRLISYIAVLLMFSAALHSVVVCKLLKQMHDQQFRVFMTPRARRHVYAVGAIGIVTVLCCFVRGVVLFGRVLSAEAFVSGAFSFENPWMTTSYYVLLMNVPCLVIAGAFFVLSIELTNEQYGAVDGQGIGDGEEHLAGGDGGDGAGGNGVSATDELLQSGGQLQHPHPSLPHRSGGFARGHHNVGAGVVSTSSSQLRRSSAAVVAGGGGGAAAGYGGTAATGGEGLGTSPAAVTFGPGGPGAPVGGSGGGSARRGGRYGAPYATKPRVSSSASVASERTIGSSSGVAAFGGGAVAAPSATSQPRMADDESGV